MSVELVVHHARVLAMRERGAEVSAIVAVAVVVAVVLLLPPQPPPPTPAAAAAHAAAAAAAAIVAVVVVVVVVVVLVLVLVLVVSQTPADAREQTCKAENGPSAPKGPSGSTDCSRSAFACLCTRVSGRLGVATVVVLRSRPLLARHQ